MAAYLCNRTFWIFNTAHVDGEKYAYVYKYPPRELNISWAKVDYETVLKSLAMQ